ncbi:hypothetical protein Tco_1333641 [Tanacetum coccineum]
MALTWPENYLDSLHGDLKEELKEEMKVELQDEMKNELKEEMCEELKEEVREELKEEMRAKIQDMLVEYGIKSPLKFYVGANPWIRLPFMLSKIRFLLNLLVI